MSNKKMLSIISLSVALTCFICFVFAGIFFITEFNALKHMSYTDGAEYFALCLLAGMTFLGISLTGCITSLVSLCLKASNKLRILSIIGLSLFSLLFLLTVVFTYQIF